jgi:hypothetical protein
MVQLLRTICPKAYGWFAVQFLVQGEHLLVLLALVLLALVQVPQLE